MDPLRERLPAALQCGQNLQRGNNAVPRGVAIQAEQVPGAFATEQPAALLQLLEHEPVTDVGTCKLDAHGLELTLQAEIRHQGAHYAGNRRARQPFAHHCVQELVAVVDPARTVNHLDTIGVSVQGNAKVCTDRRDLRAKFAEHMRCDVISGAVGRINHQLEPAQVQVRGKRALAKLDIPPGGIVDAPGPAEFFGRHATEGFLQCGLDGLFHRVRQLGALVAEEFDAVVVIGVMRSADHDACVKPPGTGQVGDRRRGHGPDEEHVDPCRGKAGFKR